MTPLPYSVYAHLFLTVRTQIKLYHWQTQRYARHKATDRFIETFEPLVARFVEAAQGITIANAAPRIVDYAALGSQHKNFIRFFENTLTDGTALEYLSFFREILNDLSLPQSELAQIRDDMLEIADITLYLFTLKWEAPVILLISDPWFFASKSGANVTQLFFQVADYLLGHSCVIRVILN